LMVLQLADLMVESTENRSADPMVDGLAV